MLKGQDPGAFEVLVVVAPAEEAPRVRGGAEDFANHEVYARGFAIRPHEAGQDGDWVDPPDKCDYIGHMIKTLRESKAKLSELVELAAGGEEVIITVRGKPKARLCPIERSSPSERRDAKAWGNELREARGAYSVGTHDTGEGILDDLRGDRS